jgi:hypothetical protein
MSDEPNPGGRPEHEVTQRTRNLVQVMHANGITQPVIARLIGCDPKTLRKHYRQEMRNALDCIEATIGAAVVQSAHRGNVAAQKLWLQSHAKDPRWRMPEPHSISGDPNAPPVQIALSDMTDDDIRRELADIVERQRVAAETRGMASALPRRSNGMDH